MSTSQIEAVKAAAVFFGSQACLARALGVTPVTVGQWLKPEQSTGRAVPPKQCVRIEHLTAGVVTRQGLRPDDWQEIWPELAGTPKFDVPGAARAVDGKAQKPLFDTRSGVPGEGVCGVAWIGADRRQVKNPPPPDLERREPEAARLAGQGV